MKPRFRPLGRPRKRPKPKIEGSENLQLDREFKLFNSKINRFSMKLNRSEIHQIDEIKRIKEALASSGLFSSGVWGLFPGFSRKKTKMKIFNIKIYKIKNGRMFSTESFCFFSSFSSWLSRDTSFGAS